MDGGAWWAAVHGVVKSQIRLSNFTFTFLHWRRKWQPTPVFLPGESQGWGRRVGHDWSDLAAAAAGNRDTQKRPARRDVTGRARWDTCFPRAGLDCSRISRICLLLSGCGFRGPISVHPSMHCRILSVSLHFWVYISLTSVSSLPFVD